MSNPGIETNTGELQRRNRELSILNAIAEALNREVDLTRALQVALAQVVALFNLHTGWIFLLDKSGRSYLAATHHLPPALTEKPERMVGTCYCLDSYLEGDLEGAANVNIITCTRLKELVDGTDGLRYHASVPLYARGKQLGMLNVASPDWHEPSPDDLRLLNTVGELVSIAVERARLFEQSTQIGAIEERNRLAREMHDTIAQGLAAITMQLETADLLLEPSEGLERVRQAVRHALALTRANLEEARRSVLDLRAAPLEGRTLPEALEALARETSAKWSLPVNVEATSSVRPLPVRIEVGLYRVAQEALNNVVRHAEARHLNLLLRVTPEQAQMTIEDDGRGFDPTQIPKGRFGLIGLNERVHLMGGHLKLHSHKGQGTRLDVTIPLKGWSEP